MKYLLILAALISGCSSVPQEKIPEKVLVPVAVSCVSSVPSKPTLQYNPGSYTEVFPLVRDLKGDREMMIAYQGELEAVVTGCMIKDTK